MKEYYELIEDLDGSYKFVPITPTIKGFSIEEIITILNGLELERIFDIKVTMGNLGILSDKLQEDFKNSLNKSMEQIIKNQFKE